MLTPFQFLARGGLNDLFALLGVCSTWHFWSQRHLKFAQESKLCQHLGVDAMWRLHHELDNLPIAHVIISHCYLPTIPHQVIQEEVCETVEKCETVTDTECRSVPDQVCQDVSVPGEVRVSHLHLSSNSQCHLFSIFLDISMDPLIQGCDSSS